MAGSDSNGTDITTRDDAFYQDVLHSGVVNSYEYESTISGIDGRLFWVIDWTAFGRHSKLYRKKLIYQSYEKCCEVINQSDFSLYNATTNALGHPLSLPDSKEITIYPIVMVDLEIELPDETTITVHSAELLDSIRDSWFAEFSYIQQSDGFVDVTKKKNGRYTIEAEYNTTTAYTSREGVLENLPESVVYETLTTDRADEKVYTENCDFDNFINYASVVWDCDSTTVRCVFGPLRDNGENAYMTMYNDGSVITEFTFENVKSDDGMLWKLANTISNGDPLMLEGEEIYLSLLSYCDESDGLCVSNPWVLFEGKQQENTALSLIVERFQDIL